VKLFFVVEEDSAINYAESSSSSTFYEGSFFSSSSSAEGLVGVSKESGIRIGGSSMLRSPASLECFYLNENFMRSVTPSRVLLGQSLLLTTLLG
jgi:hypothetical protein